MFFSKTIEKIISVRRENQNKNTVSVFSRHTKNRLVKYGHFIFQVIGSKWFSFLKKNMKKMKLE